MIHIKLSAQINSDSLRFYSNLALEPQSASDLNKAYNFFETNYNLLVRKGDTLSAINSLYYKASVLYKNGEYDASEKTAVTAINHLSGIEESPYVLKVKLSFCNLLGLLYTEQNNEIKAIELYGIALEIAETPQDSAKIINNKALVYKNSDKRQKAKEEILKAYEIIPRVNDTLTQALIIDNYGMLESESNKRKALSLLYRGLKLRQSVNDNSTIYTSYAHLSQFYFKNDSLKKSKEYALKALKLAGILKSPSYRNDALGLLINLSDDNYAKAYKKINDSLYNAEKESNNKFALIRYDYSKFQQQAIENKLEEQKQRNLKTMFLSIALFAISLGVFLFYFLRIRHKKNTLQQVFKTESRISKKVHDGIANDIYQVMNTLQTNENISDEVKNDIGRIYDKARDISKQLGEVELNGDYDEILNDLALRYSDEDVNVVLKDVSKIAWDKMSAIKKTALFKILQELLINMKKHSKASVAIIAFKTGSKKVFINYSDDGIGCNLKKSNGLHNVENRIQAVGGIINFQSEINKGFKAEIEI